MARAKLIGRGERGSELRLAETGRDTWPGKGRPLGHEGYWYGWPLALMWCGSGLADAIAYPAENGIAIGIRPRSDLPKSVRAGYGEEKG